MPKLSEAADKLREAAADLVPGLAALGVTEPSMNAPSIPMARKVLSET